jgi:hypothetical protein
MADESERDAPNPETPENLFIASATSPAGAPVEVAFGHCECNEDRDTSRTRFWLLAGEHCECEECGRVYSFDGEAISVIQP